MNVIAPHFLMHSNFMLIGYARVSTIDQNTDLQTDALKIAGCQKIFIDKISGVKSDCPELNKLKEQLRAGETLVVWRLDRLGRSLRDLIDWMNYLEKQKVMLKSLQESIDTGNPTGKLIFHIFGALSEFERNLIVERTNAGLQAARARGIKGGRKPKLDASKQKTAQTMYDARNHTIKEICETLKISKPTLYKYLKR